jgi:Lipopolysaccharide-assembly
MRTALIIALALTTSSCGYALAGRGSFLPDYIRIVGIPPIENRSTYQQVELVLTEKVRTEFIGRGKYTVVPEASGADAVLSAEITGISAQPVGFNESQLASRYLFIMTMRVQLTDTRTNMVLWSNDALSFREESELTTRGATVLEGAAFIDQERSSFDRIASDVARTVVTAILEAF